MTTAGRDWREAIQRDPLCCECAEPAAVLLWHFDALPWAHFCDECLLKYQQRHPKRKVQTRPVRESA